MPTTKKSTASKKPKPSVKWSKAVQDFIIAEISNGLTLTAIVRQYPSKVPSRRTIYDNIDKDTAFRDRLNEAYNVWLYDKLDQLEYISSAPLEELYPELDFKSASEARRARIDTLKFMTAKMAPILSKKWSSKVEIEHSGAATIVVADYATAP